MKQKKLLAILGSPHKNGTTAAMLTCALDAAEAAGYAITKIDLYEKQLAFCKGCHACEKNGFCILPDDIIEITAALKSADVVVLAAPVYWANVPAVVKNLFDRLFGTAMEETRTFPKPRLKGKRYLLLTACHTPAPFSYLFGQSRCALHSMDEFFKTAGMKCIGRVVRSNAHGKNALPKSLIKKIQRCFRKINK